MIEVHDQLTPGTNRGNDSTVFEGRCFAESLVLADVDNRGVFRWASTEIRARTSDVRGKSFHSEDGVDSSRKQKR